MAQDFSPVWDGWGVVEYAIVLGLPALLVTAIVIAARQPASWERFEAKYRQITERSELRGEANAQALKETVGERRATRLLLYGFWVSLVGWFAYGWDYIFQPKGWIHASLMVVITITTPIVIGTFFFLDYSSQRRRLSRPLIASWISAGVFLLITAIVNLVDNTTQDQLRTTIIKWIVFGIPALTFVIARWRLRAMKERPVSEGS
jgi:hypothetical protein